MRTHARERRQITTAKLRLLRPILRYSYARDAYILRLVGDSVGPVFQLDPGDGSDQR